MNPKEKSYDEMAIGIVERFFKEVRVDPAIESSIKDIILEKVNRKSYGRYEMCFASKTDGNKLNGVVQNRIKGFFELSGITIDDFSIRKVTPREFNIIASDLSNFLGMELGYSIGDSSKPEEYVPALCDHAKDRRASDIHIFPPEKDEKDNYLAQIKLRIDGILQPTDRLDPGGFEKVIRHLHRQIPNVKEGEAVIEGGFEMKETPGVTYRLSSMFMENSRTKLNKGSGYCTTIRVLKADKPELSLKQLGYLQHDENKVQDLIKERSGVILATGETGSGKTTTIMSLANGIQKKYEGGKKIMTLEDPVEYELRGVQQFTVHKDDDKGKKLTFENGLSSILRQDPDVIVVGEVRTRQTAHDVFNLAHTGHLVLATMHSDTATGALSRLAEWGISGALMNSCLKGIISQYLIRATCKMCINPEEQKHLTEEQARYLFRQPNEINDEDYSKFLQDAMKLPIKYGSGFTRGEVCPKCEGLKYYDRIPIVQIFKNRPEHYHIVSAIAKGEPDAPKKMIELFQEGKYTSFALNALFHIMIGNTTPEEVINYLPPSCFEDYGAVLTRNAKRIMEKKEVRG